jgi:hypothetical protein
MQLSDWQFYGEGQVAKDMVVLSDLVLESHILILSVLCGRF